MIGGILPVGRAAAELDLLERHEATRRAAHRELAAWTAEVARRLASAGPRTVSVASARIV